MKWSPGLANVHPKFPPYIVIEGISGSGKTTQVQLLKQKYEASGQQVVTLHEPTPWLEPTRKLILQPEQWDNFSKVLMLLLDRHLNVRRIIDEAHTAGKVVIADRCYLSTMVYQVDDGFLTPANIAFMHQMIPQPTHIFVLNADPEEALRRIEKRQEEVHAVLGHHETLDQLRLHRQRFLSLKEIFPFLQILDMQAYDSDTINQQIWAMLDHI